VGHVQKYSDNLLQFRLKGIYPDKYNPRGGVVAINNQPINVTVGTEQAREFTERMLKGEGT
jgi:hypothetical protein